MWIHSETRTWHEKTYRLEVWYKLRSETSLPEFFTFYLFLRFFFISSNVIFNWNLINSQYIFLFLKLFFQYVFDYFDPFFDKNGVRFRHLKTCWNTFGNVFHSILCLNMTLFLKYLINTLEILFNLNKCFVW